MPRNTRGFRKKALSLTALTDVIFLLLLYFILSSTFQRYGEITLTTADGGGAAAADPARQVLFLQLGPEALALNGETTAPEALPAAIAALLGEEGQGQAVLALREGVDAQRMTDVLVALRRIPGLTVTVIG